MVPIRALLTRLPTPPGTPAAAEIPFFLWAANSRRAYRNDKPISPAASSPVCPCRSTWFNTNARCCSLSFNVTVALSIEPALSLPKG